MRGPRKLLLRQKSSRLRSNAVCVRPILVFDSLSLHGAKAGIGCIVGAIPSPLQSMHNERLQKSAFAPGPWM
eukprot:scaffold54714_cov17-Tisochrysis_lutea.AAC.1